jgi:hypothetical protein
MVNGTDEEVKVLNGVQQIFLGSDLSIMQVLSIITLLDHNWKHKLNYIGRFIKREDETENLDVANFTN